MEKLKPWEITETLGRMTVIIDTREQKTDRAEARYRAFPRKTRRALAFGDYSAFFELPDGSVFSLEGKVHVERKMSIDELCQCYTHDRGRFEREFERADRAGAKLYLLVEDASWEKMYGGRYRSKMRSNALIASALAWLARYRCQILFCEPRTSGKLIRDILYREGKERLEAENGDD